MAVVGKGDAGDSKNMRGLVYVYMEKKYVYEVYKERSFTKAAQNLYISQPSLSARIKKRLKRLSGNRYLTEVQHRSSLQRLEKYISRQRRRLPRSNSGWRITSMTWRV